MTMAACAGSALLMWAWPRAAEAVRWAGVGAVVALVNPAVGMLAPIAVLAVGLAARRESSGHGSGVLLLADCPRCQHRWTEDAIPAIPAPAQARPLVRARREVASAA